MASQVMPFPRPRSREQRAAPRHKVHVSRATVRQIGHEAVEALLMDLSIFGCRVSSEERFDKGDRVFVRFAGSLPIAAEVIWSDNGETGCRFDKPLERSLLRSLILLSA